MTENVAMKYEAWGGTCCQWTDITSTNPRGCRCRELETGVLRSSSAARSWAKGAKAPPARLRGQGFDPRAAAYGRRCRLRRYGEEFGRGSNDPFAVFSESRSVLRAPRSVARMGLASGRGREVVRRTRRSSPQTGYVPFGTPARNRLQVDRGERPAWRRARHRLRCWASSPRRSRT